jgi:hypothetical protein
MLRESVIAHVFITAGMFLRVRCILKRAVFPKQTLFSGVCLVAPGAANFRAGQSAKRGIVAVRKNCTTPLIIVLFTYSYSAVRPRHVQEIFFN